jgi:hypothetical protein
MVIIAVGITTTYLYKGSKVRVCGFLGFKDRFANDLVGAILDKGSKVSDVFQDDIADLIDHRVTFLPFLKRFHKPAIRFMDFHNVPKDIPHQRFSSFRGLDDIACQEWFNPVLPSTH